MLPGDPMDGAPLMNSDISHFRGPEKSSGKRTCDHMHDAVED